MNKILQWLNEPVKEPCRRWKVGVLWIIILALTAMVFVIGEVMFKELNKL